MKVGELVNEINKAVLTVEELRILNQLVVRHIKATKKAEALKKGAILQEGDAVHKKLEGLTGKIMKVKRTKAVVRITSTGNQYNVPMELIARL